MELIAFVGFIGSGKDTVAQHMIANEGFRGFAFADCLKDAISAVFCWDRELLEGSTAESRVWRETVDTWWADKLNIPNLTPRWVLQHFGTEVMRKSFHEDIWIFNMERRLSLLGEDAKIVVTDARFRNEIAMARRFGGKIVRVRRGEDPKWFYVARAANNGDKTCLQRMWNEFDIHESEWAWIGTHFDHVIENNGTVEDLLSSALELR
jgi:hypothetical protein